MVFTQFSVDLQCTWVMVGSYNFRLCSWVMDVGHGRDMIESISFIIRFAGLNSHVMVRCVGVTGWVAWLGHGWVMVISHCAGPNGWVSWLGYGLNHGPMIHDSGTTDRGWVMVEVM